MLTRLIARIGLALSGWRVDSRLPKESHYVMVVAYHTSNWDFVHGLMAKWLWGEHFVFVAKHSLFWPPLGWFLRCIGGVPVDRRVRGGFIEKMVEQFQRRDQMKLVILPEGTRSKVDHWKTGFYYIATQARVPIAFGYFDYKNRVVGVGGQFTPSGDIEKDLHIIEDFYRDKTGKYPEKHGIIRLKE
mgnify:FL=1